MQRIKYQSKERTHTHTHTHIERERERERVFTFLCEQNMDWMEEKITKFYSKRNGEKNSQNKKKMKRWRNCKVKV